MQTNPAVEQKKIIGPRIRRISPVEKDRLWRKGFPGEHTLADIPPFTVTDFGTERLYATVYFSK